jgi:hypothetical protein
LANAQGRRSLRSHPTNEDLFVGPRDGRVDLSATPPRYSNSGIALSGQRACGKANPEASVTRQTGCQTRAKSVILSTLFTIIVPRGTRNHRGFSDFFRVSSENFNQNCNPGPRILKSGSPFKTASPSTPAPRATAAARTPSWLASASPQSPRPRPAQQQGW